MTRQRREARMRCTVRRAFAWAALLALCLLLATALQAMASKALIEPRPSSSAVELSPVTAALADGDDVRARFLAGLRSQGPGSGASPQPPERLCVAPHC
jgi:hypothetical protein